MVHSRFNLENLVIFEKESCGNPAFEKHLLLPFIEPKFVFHIPNSLMFSLITKKVLTSSILKKDNKVAFHFHKKNQGHLSFQAF